MSEYRYKVFLIASMMFFFLFCATSAAFAHGGGGGAGGGGAGVDMTDNSFGVNFSGTPTGIDVANAVSLNPSPTSDPQNTSGNTATISGWQVDVEEETQEETMDENINDVINFLNENSSTDPDVDTEAQDINELALQTIAGMTLQVLINFPNLSYKEAMKVALEILNCDFFITMMTQKGKN